VVWVSPPFTLDGVVEGTPPGTRPLVLLYSASGGETAAAVAEPAGSFHVEGLYPGKYRVGSYSQLSGHYLGSVLLGSQDVTGRDVTLASDSPRLHVIYKPNAARVRGAVEDGAGVRVVLIEADRDRQIPTQWLRAATCDEQGRFAVEGLRPGLYHAFAFQIVNVNTGAVQEAVFEKGLVRQGKTISLAEGETATLELRVTPWPE
jgi:hypothetical protein